MLRRILRRITGTLYQTAALVGLVALAIATAMGPNNTFKEWFLPDAHAVGVFDTASYLEPGQWSVGAEPEVIVSNGTGAGLNIRPRYATTENLTWGALIGTGSGARKFRIGGQADVEWFPDLGKQPGIATPFFAEYFRIEEDGLMTFGARPMIYKTFNGQEAKYTPFLALPLGWNYRNSTVEGFVQIAMGSMFQLAGEKNWKFTLEGGFNARNSYSYISGGVTYFQF